MRAQLSSNVNSPINYFEPIALQLQKQGVVIADAMDAEEFIGHVTPAAECGEVDNGYVMSISASDFEETR